jgi:hypothetical protein
MKRTALKRYTAIKRTGPIKRRAPKRLSRAGSDPAYLAWVRTLPCIANDGTYKFMYCDQVIHAHHAIHRSQGGKDDVAVPLCLFHHAEWHAHRGIFSGLSKLQRFAWAQQAIASTQRLYERDNGRAAG